MAAIRSSDPTALLVSRQGDADIYQTAGPEWFLARIDGSASVDATGRPPHSWAEVQPKPDATGYETRPGGRSGTTTSGPAYPVRGTTAATTGALVLMRFGTLAAGQERYEFFALATSADPGAGPTAWMVSQVCPEFADLTYVAPGEAGVITPAMLADQRLPARLLQYPRLRRAQSALGASVNVTGVAGAWTDVLTVTAPVAGVYVVRYDARTYIQAAGAGTGAFMVTRVLVGGTGLAASRRFSAWAQAAWAMQQETVSCEHGPITLAGGDVVTLQATAGESANPWAAQVINDQTVLSLLAIEGSTLNINGDANLAP